MGYVIESDSDRTAVLVDASFYLQRYLHFKREQGNPGALDPERAVNDLYKMACLHADPGGLYKIFVYDCPPTRCRIDDPQVKASIGYNEAEQSDFRADFQRALISKRKVVLQLGRQMDQSEWVLDAEPTRKLLDGEISVAEAHADLRMNRRPPGVGMQLGLDIAAIAYKGFANRIVLMAADQDFVPAAKLARREGIDFVLDPMYANIHDSLYEHIDGLKSYARVLNQSRRPHEDRGDDPGESHY